MKKIQIIQENDNICAKEYLNLNSKTVYRKFEGKKVLDYLNYNTRYLIKNIFENGDEFQIEYDDFLICINRAVLLNFYVSPLLNQINRFVNKKTSDNSARKKVTRVNKHVNKKIIATGIALTIFLGNAFIIKNNNVSKNEKNTELFISADNDINDYDIKEKIQDMIINDQEHVSKNIIIKNDEKEVTVSTPDLTSEGINIENEEDYKLNINYSEFNPDLEKLEFVKRNYGDIISYYSDMYGLNASIMIAIATQERGIHSSTMDDGGATGLMQIQNSAWVGESLRAFNYNLNDYEEITVTDDMISDLEQNIKVGCMIFADALKLMKNNVLAAIQCYNMGFGSMMTILKNYGYDIDKEPYDILENPKDIGWLKYRNIVGIGDEHYLERILAYVGDTVLIENQGTNLLIDTTSKVK